MTPPFLILETGLPVEPLRRHGSFAHWIRVAAGLRRDEAVGCRVVAGDPLPAAEGFAGVLVSGSGAMVTEGHDWSEASAAWLRGAVERGLPVFAICYGHQLLAHALGGRVGDNPRGREMGTHPVQLHEGAADDPLLGGLPPAFDAQLTHLQTVLEPPPGARVLARSAGDDCQAFRVGDHAWGVQFHPEFSAGIMRGYIDARAPAIAAEGQCPRTMRGNVRAAPLAREVMRRFVRHVRRRPHRAAAHP